LISKIFSNIELLKITMTLVITPINDSQKDLLIKLAEELHLTIEVIDDENIDIKSLVKLSESSFAKEWDTADDAHWDTLLKSDENVSKG